MNEITVKTALDNAKFAWLQQKWIGFHCPECHEMNHLEIDSYSLKEGYLDGAPVPCFISKRQLQLEDIKVKVSKDHMKIKSLNLSWKINKK